MKTLIELFDTSPIDNVLSTDIFNPERVIFLCPSEVAQNKTLQKKLINFISKRHENIAVEFLETSKYYTDKIVAQMEKIVDEYEDCAIDVSGGSDNMLFAAGIVCERKNVGAFTYSRAKNKFFNIKNAEYADGISCNNIYSIEDFMEMAGGKADTGRVSDKSLDEHLKYVEPLFSVFIKYKSRWSRIISWIQQASRNGGIRVVGAQFKQNCERGMSDCPVDCLKELEKAGLIRNLIINNTVSFDFVDSQVKFWLRDVGSALEVFTYKMILDSKKYSECKCSVIAEWESEDTRKTVYNEIDVLAVSGIKPYFVSCKACKINTYALNELQILRDRFGGKAAGAAIVSTERCSYSTRRRAEALNIRVIDFDEIKRGFQNGKEEIW